MADKNPGVTHCGWMFTPVAGFSPRKKTWDHRWVEVANGDLNFYRRTR